MRKNIAIVLTVSAILIAGVLLTGCTSENSSSGISTTASQVQATGTPSSEKVRPSGTPPADMQVNGTHPSGTPPAGMEMNMTRPSGTPPADMPNDGTRPSGTPPEGGVPPSGSPPSGTLPEGTQSGQ